MDDHRADSIDCPEMRTTKGMTDETYEAHLRQLAIKQTNGASTEDMDALWEATEKNKSSIDKLAKNFEKYMNANTEQIVKLTDLIGKLPQISANKTVFMQDADSILNGQWSRFSKGQALESMSIDWLAQILEIAIKIKIKKTKQKYEKLKKIKKI